MNLNTKILFIFLLIFLFLLIFIFLNKSSYELFDYNTEEKCKYVSSYGIMKSCNIYSSSKPISSIKILKDYDFTKGFDNCCIYICTSALREFVSKINDINYKFILVSGDSDESTPTDIFNTNEEFNKFIENNKIIHWYAQNCIGKHHKLSNIPIGLDYHTRKTPGTVSERWGHIMTPKEQETEIHSLINVS